jgi:DNA-binding CsgD family transcriptional regulator
LTPREREVALLVARNFSNDEIARELGIKRRTVEVHVHKILKKGGLSCRLRRL